MHLRREATGTKAQARSKITNGRKLFEHKPTPARSQRRFRDLLEAYTAQYEIATEADRALVKNAATLTLQQEEMAAAKVRGERINGDDMVRMSSELRRVLSELKRRAQDTAPPTPSFIDQWASNHEDEHELQGGSEA